MHLWLFVHAIIILLLLLYQLGKNYKGEKNDKTYSTAEYPADLVDYNLSILTSCVFHAIESVLTPGNPLWSDVHNVLS